MKTFRLVASLLFSFVGIGTSSAQTSTTLPRGGAVTPGTAVIQSNPNVINQSNTILNWQTFSISPNAVANFNQPSTSAVIDNRVNLQEIIGTLVPRPALDRVGQPVAMPTRYSDLGARDELKERIIVVRPNVTGQRVMLDFVGDGLIHVVVDKAAVAPQLGTDESEAIALTADTANALLDRVVNDGGVIRARTLVEMNGELVLRDSP